MLTAANDIAQSLELAQKNVESYNQGWEPGYLALGCQFQFRCVETQMSGFSLGLVSRLLKNRF